MRVGPLKRALVPAAPPALPLVPATPAMVKTLDPVALRMAWPLEITTKPFSVFCQVAMPWGAERVELVHQESRLPAAPVPT